MTTMFQQVYPELCGEEEISIFFYFTATHIYVFKENYPDGKEIFIGYDSLENVNKFKFLFDYVEQLYNKWLSSDFKQHAMISNDCLTNPNTPSDVKALLNYKVRVIKDNGSYKVELSKDALEEICNLYVLPDDSKKYLVILGDTISLVPFNSLNISNIEDIKRNVNDYFSR